MRVVRRLGARLAWLVALIAWAAAIAPASHAGNQQQTGQRVMLAQLLPFERNKVEPIDPRAAFVEGYQAYKRRDFIETIGRMQLAYARLPALADYALFYLASAESGSGNRQQAADDFRRLTLDYSQSVFCDAAGLDYARLELALGHAEYALSAAAAVAAHTGAQSLEQSARMIMARAMFGNGSWAAAYQQAQLIRRKFPDAGVDPQARELASAILRAHPEVNQLTPLNYHRDEAALLLREGQQSAALEQIGLAMQLRPPRPVLSQLLWLSAQAMRASPEQMAVELKRYLAVAPSGTRAARALSELAHLHWLKGDTARARFYFNGLVRRFPQSALAPAAMFEIGRTYEEDGDLAHARAAYLRLERRYPGVAIAADAGFRASFMLYMLGRYSAAAAEFGEARALSTSAGERDRFAYWQARALQQEGQSRASQRILRLLAHDTATNYYPALAAMRVNAGPALLPAALASDLVAGPTPSVVGPLQFHLSRITALRALGLSPLEAPELRLIERRADNRELRTFVLAEFQTTGAWFDAIELATRMAAQGQIDPLIAERIRYPRGFWDLVGGAAERTRLDPLLVAALIRQESLFNPAARSTSDARGLMQLLPGTAERYAAGAGVSATPLDLYDPNISVQIGTVYLRGLMTMFGNDMFKAVAAYNAGERAVAQWAAQYPGDDDQWVENIDFHETRDYVKKVIGGMREYRLLYQSASARSLSIRGRPSSG